VRNVEDRIKILGSGSDHSIFSFYAGVPSIYFRFEPDTHKYPGIRARHPQVPRYTRQTPTSTQVYKPETHKYPGNENSVDWKGPEQRRFDVYFAAFAQSEGERRLPLLYSRHRHYDCKVLQYLVPVLSSQVFNAFKPYFSIYYSIVVMPL
jgi:hypothetical protein